MPLGQWVPAKRWSLKLLVISVLLIAIASSMNSAAGLKILAEVPQTYRTLYPASAVAKLVLGTKVCTAVLVAEDKAVTARHCVLEANSDESSSYIGALLDSGDAFYSKAYLEFLDASEQSINVTVWGLKLGDPANHNDDWAILYLNTDELADWPPSNISPIPLNNDAKAFTIGDLGVMAYGFDGSKTSYPMIADFQCTMISNHVDEDIIQHTCGISNGASGGPILTYPCDSEICTDDAERFSLLGIHVREVPSNTEEILREMVPIMSFREQLLSSSAPKLVTSVRLLMGKYQLSLKDDDTPTSINEGANNIPLASLWEIVRSDSDIVSGYFYLRNRGTNTLKIYLSTEKKRASVQSDYKTVESSSGKRSTLWTLHQPSSDEEDYCIQSVATGDYLLITGKKVTMTKSCNRKSFVRIKTENETDYTSSLVSITTPTTAPTTSVAASRNVVLKDSASSNILEATVSGNKKKNTITFTLRSFGDFLPSTSLFRMTATSNSLPVVSLQNAGNGYYLSATKSGNDIKLDLLETFEEEMSEWYITAPSSGDYLCFASVKYEGHYLGIGLSTQLENTCGASNGVSLKEPFVSYGDIQISSLDNMNAFPAEDCDEDSSLDVLYNSDEPCALGDNQGVKVESLETCDELSCISQSVCACDTSDCHPVLTTTLDCFEYDPIEIHKIANYTNLQSLTLRNIGLQSSDLIEIFDGSIFDNLQFLDISENEIASLYDGLITRFPNLQSFQVGGNGLRTLPSNIGYLTKLELLNIDSNRIEELPDSITNLASLSSLALVGNRVSMLPDGFSRLTNLGSVTFEGNSISSLENAGSFAKFEALTYLNFFGNSLTSLPQDFTKMKSLRWLSLSRNGLDKLPSSLSDLSQLTWLSVSVNELTELPDSMTHLTGLTSIDIDANKLTNLPSGIGNLLNLRAVSAQGGTEEDHQSTILSLPDSMSNLSNLLSLNLENALNLTSDKSMPSVIAQLSALTLLNIANNEISALPDSLTTLTNLRTLNLGGNEISELPSGFGALTRLQELTLINNELTSLPESFAKLTWLQSMALSKNPFRSLPESFGEMTDLTILDLSENGNDFVELPDSFTNLQSLKKLTVSTNPQMDFFDILPKLTNLEYLNIARNNYTAIPEQVAKLTNLRYLAVLDNNLKELDLSTLMELTTLEAEGNINLTDFPNSLTQLTKLRYIDLSDADIAELPKKMDKLTALAYLDLSSNSFTSLPDVVGKLSSLTQLDVSSNSGMTTLSNNLGNLGLLRRADFSSNSLVALPKSISGLTSLTNLNLQGNTGLTSMPTGIWTLPSLQSLDISGCSSITSIPNAISGLTALTELDLGSCKVAEVPNGLGSLSNLKTLNFASNNLRKLPASMSGLSAMVNLDVRSNIITAIDEAVFEGMPRLTSLNLESNYMFSLPSSLTNLMNLESFNLLPANDFCGTYPVWNYTIPDIDFEPGASKNC